MLLNCVGTLNIRILLALLLILWPGQIPGFVVVVDSEPSRILGVGTFTEEMLPKFRQNINERV